MLFLELQIVNPPTPAIWTLCARTDVSYQWFDVVKYTTSLQCVLVYIPTWTKSVRQFACECVSRSEEHHKRTVVIHSNYFSQFYNCGLWGLNLERERFKDSTTVSSFEFLIQFVLCWWNGKYPQDGRRARATAPPTGRMPTKNLTWFGFFFALQVTLHTGLPIPDFYTPGDADPTGSMC